MLKDNIRKYRKASRLTQQELASMLGVTKSAVGNYESGYRDPDIETLTKMASIFGVSLDTLTGIEPPAKAHIKSDEEELMDCLEEMRTRPDMKMIFSLTRGCKKEDIARLVPIIEAYVRGLSGE